MQVIYGRGILLLIILAILLPAGVSALVTYDGSQVSIDQPVHDDVFASGGTVDINAPVDSLVAVGGTVTINAPVAGDVIAAGGTVSVNGDIGGKLIAAGGTITVNRDIGTNAILAGGTVTLGPGVTVGRDAMVTGGQVTNAGTVTGNLSVSAQSFDDRGTAGHLEVELSEPRDQFSAFRSLGLFLLSVGMFFLGLVLIRVAPARFIAVEEEARRSPLVKTIAGFFGIIVAFIVLILVSITIVLLPLAFILWEAFFLGLLISTLVVSLAFGRTIAGYLKWEAPPWQFFIVGFIVLNLLFRVPVVGIIFVVIAVSLGTAAFFWTIWLHRDVIRGAEG
ncbi:MAG: hypothetical protein WC382_09235 [Methanoregulaceae archaeon]